MNSCQASAWSDVTGWTTVIIAMSVLSGESLQSIPALFLEERKDSSIAPSLGLVNDIQNFDTVTTAHSCSSCCGLLVIDFSITNTCVISPALALHRNLSKMLVDSVSHERIKEKPSALGSTCHVSPRSISPESFDL